MRCSDQLLSDRRALARAFPLAFMPPKTQQPKVPLKLGILADMLDRGVIGDDGEPLTERRIRRAVSDYCSGQLYHRACAAGGVRRDLDGNPAGEVTTEQQAWHRERSRRKPKAMRDAPDDPDERPTRRGWHDRAEQFAADVTAGLPVDPEAHGRFLDAHCG